MNSIELGRYKRIVQYFWDPEPRNDGGLDSSVWCLGKRYLPFHERVGDGNHKQSTVVIDSDAQHPGQLKRSASDTPFTYKATQTNERIDHGWPAAFLDDFESRIWLTYRSNFPLIPRSEDPSASSSMTMSVRLRSQILEPHGFTSDTGWGCMIRSGQSLLANTLSILMLGRDWRRGTRISEESRLLSLFADNPKAPFSIHRFVSYGASSCGKYPGEWFGPSATARCIQALSSECDDMNLNVYVTNDSSDVYENKFRDIARRELDHFTPTLILLGIRLGIDRITPIYWNSLKALLKHPQSVGIAGGRPSASHYFVGVQDSCLFYLDPHHTRPALSYRDVGDVHTEEELNSCHTRRLRRLHVKDLDPSMLIGFLIKDEEDWIDWKRRVSIADEKPIINIYSSEDAFASRHEREDALDEVEALDEDLCL